MKQSCPICGKKFDDVIRHLRLAHDIRDLNELTQKVNNNKLESIPEIQNSNLTPAKKSDESKNPLQVKDVKRDALIAVIHLRNEQRDDHRLENLKIIATAISMLPDEKTIDILFEAFQNEVKRTSDKSRRLLTSYIDDEICDSLNMRRMKTILRPDL